MGTGRTIRKAAVLGAGVMGAQIAAHLTNADVETLLYELPADGPDANANSRAAVKKLLKHEPAPLATAERGKLIVPCNYQTDLDALGDCDLVIEAIAERMDWKADLYAKVEPHLKADCRLVTNTSGLPLHRLSKVLPEGRRHRFCGMHFFNPPRYMPLVELIPGPDSDSSLMDELETFLVSGLGKGVIRAKDTPNFVANRIGVLSMMSTLHHAEALGIPPDTVDALTGPAIGRPKSATFRTADVVGLDTLAHVVRGSAEALRDDPWHQYYALPEWLTALIDRGVLGQKTKAGVYRKAGKEIQVFDVDTGDYRPSRAEVASEVQAILADRDPAARFAALRACDHPQARFLWAIHRDVFHYAATMLAEIADNARDLDLAVRWGFGWRHGPFEIWQVAGWQSIADAVRQDIDDGRALSTTPLPDWVFQVNGVHSPEGSWSASRQTLSPRSPLPVYRRQVFPERVFGEAADSPGDTLFENEGVRLWTLDGRIGIASFKSKMHAVGGAVLDGIQAAVDHAEGSLDALVIWQPKAPFSAGADLAEIAPLLEAGEFSDLEAVVGRFQDTTARLRYSSIPVVAAAQGLALGGGCELLMHCDHVVAALETYVGLVEVGVGLLPAGGGCKILAQRAALDAIDGDVFRQLKGVFETVAMAKVAKSALEAQQMGLLRPCDTVVLNPGELLYVALQQARALAESAYRPPLRRPHAVAGRTGIANLETMMVNMKAGGFISEHDFEIGQRIATALCGGDIEPGSEVSESWLLGLERRAFIDLARTELSQARIAHMLKTGKPLRN
jgi:3-hydroxyacyl-CoA dehydrogenase